MILGAFGIWCSGLSVAIYNTSNTVGGLTASVADIQKSTEGLPDEKAEIDWLVKQRGYNPNGILLSQATTSRQ